MHVNITEYNEIEQPEVKSTVPPEIEETILLSFGHAILEFEATLYQKFLRITNGLVVTCREFQGYLKNMEERGVVISTEFLGKRCWTIGSDKNIHGNENW